MAKRTGKRRRIRPNGNGIVVHMLANKGVCDCCGKEVDQEIFLPGMCDVHTHGMKKHGLVELRMVLEYPKEMIAYIVNTVSDRIISGETIEKDGVIIEGIFEDGAKIRLNECIDACQSPRPFLMEWTRLAERRRYISFSMRKDISFLLQA